MEIITPKPGRYIIAVSGGVDSAVLLDLLTRYNGLELVVAHYDHGIRPTSAKDAEFVRELAARLKCRFISERGELGPKASEAIARAARYKFLESARQAVNAEAIITAHHLDDVIETAIINMIRGGGRKALTSLAATDRVLRPLLYRSKQEILAYASAHQLAWQEDETNHDVHYLRNHLRKNVVPKLSSEQKLELCKLIEAQRNTNEALDTLLVKYLLPPKGQTALSRQEIMQLPYDIAAEVLASWLRNNQVRDFDQKTIHRLVVAAKTAQPGKVVDVIHHHLLQIEQDRIILV